MKYCIALLLCFITTASFAQKAVYSGRVTDRSLQPIPFAIVQVEEQKDAAIYCNTNGEFAIEVEKSTAKTLSFYCVGYSRRSLPIRRLGTNSLLIKLDKRSFEITDTLSHTAKTKQDYLGDKGISNKLGGDKKGVLSLGYGDEAGLLLNTENSGYLNEVFVYIHKHNTADSQFRIHVYKAQGKVPANELTDTNIIVTVNKQEQWVSVDLTNKHIKTGKGLFVSFECVNANKSFDTSDALNSNPTRANSIGLTKGYAKHGNITYKRNIFNGAWKPLNKKTSDSKKTPLNMMAYATYTYEK